MIFGSNLSLAAFLVVHTSTWLCVLDKVAPKATGWCKLFHNSLQFNSHPIQFEFSFGAMELLRWRCHLTELLSTPLTLNTTSSSNLFPTAIRINRWFSHPRCVTLLFGSSKQLGCIFAGTCRCCENRGDCCSRKLKAENFYLLNGFVWKALVD